MAEKRRAPRQMITGQVVLVSRQETLAGQLVNASQSGLGLYAPAPAQPGSQWTVQLSLGNRAGREVGNLELPAILVHQVHTGEGLYWGLALSGLSWEQRQRWGRLLLVYQRQD